MIARRFVSWIRLGYSFRAHESGRGAVALPGVPRRGALLVALALVSLSSLHGCGSRSRVPQPPAPQVHPAAPGVSVTPVPEPAAAPGLNIQLAEAAAPVLPSPAPRLEILRPSFGELIASHDAARYEIALEVSGLTPTPDARGVLISLDGRRPRRWIPGTVLRLKDLIAEDQSIEPGAHVLFGALVDEAGNVFRSPGPSGPSPLFILDFFVGQPTALPATGAPRLFCVGPVGTFYGDEGAVLRLEIVATGTPRRSARLRIEAPPAADWFAEIDPNRPYRITGLPLGDVRISAEVGASSSAACELTINPEIVMRGR